jgi:hypothetical protein
MFAFREASPCQTALNRIPDYFDIGDLEKRPGNRRQLRLVVE